MATHSSMLALRIPGTGAWWAAVYGVTQSQTMITCCILDFVFVCFDSYLPCIDFFLIPCFTLSRFEYYTLYFNYFW